MHVPAHTHTHTHTHTINQSINHSSETIKEAKSKEAKSEDATFAPRTARLHLPRGPSFADESVVIRYSAGPSRRDGFV